MKFGKQLTAQMVQEWQEAYMDYNILKTILKQISTTKQQNTAPPSMATTPTGTLRRRMSLYRAFSSLTGRNRFSPHLKLDSSDEDDDEVILVSAVQSESSSSSDGSTYQTTYLKSSDPQGGGFEQMFFKTLDEEFNKVIKFYEGKVDEVVNEAEELSKQMDALIALRIKVDRAVIGSAAETESRVSIDLGRLARMPLDSIQEVEMSNGEIQPEGENREIGAEQISNNNYNKHSMGGRIEKFRPASLDVLNHVRINVAPQTPVSTLKSMLLLSETRLSFSKKELKKAEDLMAKAFIEFYHKLRLLKSYSYLNVLAFSKIMKKYDKITSRNASKAYLDMVDNSYLGNSEEITKLLKRVETAFIKHFANGNRRKGMKILRPTAKRERHRVTFFLGIFLGCSIALIVAIFIIIRLRDILNSPGRSQYMENIFPLYSLFGFIVLHMLMYAANIYFWKRYRVNYSFIFGFKKGTELGYREVFLVTSGLAVLTLAGILSNLEMEMDPRTQSYSKLTEIVPLFLVLVVFLITICPFNVIYRSSRFFFITGLIHCFLAPLYKVTLPDFFLADQLTSQVQLFRNLQFYVCYYGWGDYEKRSSTTCQNSNIFDIFYYIVAVVPYWLRFIQCLRRMFEEKELSHGVNGLKYLSTIVAVCMRTTFEQNRLSMFWKIMATSSSVIATVFNTYWDIVIDWGLLNRNSKNPWLRDKLLIANKSVYFIVMVLNCILRLVWMQLVMGITEAPFLHQKALISIVACLEIIRRGIWNFFRLENEHLNNVGNYRAFKSVPLPFNYNDDDDDDDEDKDI